MWNFQSIASEADSWFDEVTQRRFKDGACLARSALRVVDVMDFSAAC